MIRRILVVSVIAVSLAGGPSVANASVDDDAGSTFSPNDAPVRGPSVRERGRRSRGGSAASGAMFVIILVGFVGYTIVKRLRR